MRKRMSKLSKAVIIGLCLSLFLVGCNGTKGENDVEDVNNETDVVVEEEAEDKDQKVDENTGLVHEGELELKFAEHFAVEYYEGGYKIITDSSDRRILLVPEGKEAPEMKEEMPVIKLPIETVGSYSTIDPSWLRPIGEIDRIASVTFEQDSWRIPEIIERMESGDIVYIGKSKAIDYELLQSVDPTIHLLSKTGEEDVFPKYDELGLNYLSMGAYLEEDPRARVEWVKFAAALFDKEEEADRFFEGELARIEEVSKKIADSGEEKLKVAIVYYSPTKEMFYVNNSTGHQTVTIKLAGGINHPEVLTPEKRGNTAMTDEEFYQVMSEVDILIYDNITGHGIQTLEQLINTTDYMSDMKVIQEGRVWGLQRDFWQSADKAADVIENLHEILSTPHGEITENDYYFLMK